MAAPPSLLADREEAVHRTRHRAAHEQEIALGVHFDDPQAQLGEAPRAHMARHALSLDDARGVGARGDRARLAVRGVAGGLRKAGSGAPGADPSGSEEHTFAIKFRVHVVFSVLLVKEMV